MTDPRIDYYDWEGGREAMLRFGPDDGPVAILALPLFEEANRTRAFGVRLLRELAARGVAGVLPDLPGQGESLVPLAEVGLAGIRAAFSVAASLAHCTFAIGMRSGVLLDTTSDVAARYHFAPQTGVALNREIAKMHPPGEIRGGKNTVTVAGNIVSATLLEALEGAEAAPPARTVRVATDPLPADRKIDAAPLWRRPEPGDDPVLAQLLADDIAECIAACAG